MSAPSSWLTENARLLPRVGDALDVACGRGRHAFWLAERGLRTYAVDRDPEVVREVSEEASRRALPISASVLDLETGAVRLTPSEYDVIVVVHYLHRPLFPTLIQALRPGGVLVYETFTREQAARGHPKNPAFLLEPGELVTLVRPLEILASRDGDYDGRMVAGVIARRGAL
jgi:2-polyprenyl-3-methyl-5-hydroxy-6-metoxy-1,4-benzoquinol methylase